MIKDFYKTNKIGILITIIVLVIGNIVYFGFDLSKNDMETKEMKFINPEIYNDMEIKTAYTPDGIIKIFVNSKEFKYIDINSTEGDKIATKNNLVIGYDEAMMMKEEKLFTNIGDKIDGLFGVNIIIGGILEKTNSPIDMMHFVSETLFEDVQGDENKLFIKLKDSTPKLFLNYDNINDKEKIKIELFEGNLEEYKVIDIDNKKYYPLIIGFEEAKMMKEEKLFSKPGDKIEGLFGKSFIIVGVNKKSNSPIDMMHITTLTKEELEN